MELKISSKLSQLLFLILILFFSGCGLLKPNITYYDQVTYIRLTDLKEEISFIYEELAEESFNRKYVSMVESKLDEACKYEEEKGKDNALTFKQLKIINDKFKRHISEREKEAWDRDYMLEKKKSILDDFKNAIDAERSKNIKK